jgi:hypothetical protein
MSHMWIGQRLASRYGSVIVSCGVHRWSICPADPPTQAVATFLQAEAGPGGLSLCKEVSDSHVAASASVLLAAFC